MSLYTRLTDLPVTGGSHVSHAILLTAVARSRTFGRARGSGCGAVYKTTLAPYRPRYITRAMPWRVRKVAPCSSMAIGRDHYVIAFTMEPRRPTEADRSQQRWENLSESLHVNVHRFAARYTPVRASSRKSASRYIPVRGEFAKVRESSRKSAKVRTYIHTSIHKFAKSPHQCIHHFAVSSRKFAKVRA